MLVIDASINRVIDIGSIQILRVKTNTKTGIYTYQIREPEGFEEHRIKHRYKDDYKILLKKVLDIIVE